MGLLQKAVETYEAHSSFVGEESQEHQVLLPVSHILARADLEITLEPEGAFSSARAVDRSRSLPRRNPPGAPAAPVPILSATSSAIWPPAVRKSATSMWTSWPRGPTPPTAIPCSCPS